MNAGINKLEVHGLRSGKHRMRIRSLVLTSYHCVLDRRTDRQTSDARAMLHVAYERTEYC